MRIAIPASMYAKAAIRILLMLLIFWSSIAWSQTETFFDHSEVVRLRIEGAWGELLKRRLDSPDMAKAYPMTANVYLIADDSTELKIPATVYLRGNTSLSPIECAFPKFTLRFHTDDVSGTALSGVESMAMGSHCGSKGGNSALYGRSYDGLSPLREYVVFKIMEVLNIPSYKTRFVMAQYVDTEIATTKTARWNAAFALESQKLFSQRMGYEIINDDQAELLNLGQDDATDVSMLARIALFQQLIGNNDWRINYKIEEQSKEPRSWNVSLYKRNEPPHILVAPYDFDLAGAVTFLKNSNSESKDLLSRLPVNIIEEQKDFIVSRKDQLYQIILLLKKHDQKSYQNFKSHLNNFFNAQLK